MTLNEAVEPNEVLVKFKGLPTGEQVCPTAGGIALHPLLPETPRITAVTSKRREGTLGIERKLATAPVPVMAETVAGAGGVDAKMPVPVAAAANWTPLVESESEPCAMLSKPSIGVAPASIGRRSPSESETTMRAPIEERLWRDIVSFWGTFNPPERGLADAFEAPAARFRTKRLDCAKSSKSNTCGYRKIQPWASRSAHEVAEAARWSLNWRAVCSPLQPQSRGNFHREQARISTSAFTFGMWRTLLCDGFAQAIPAASASSMAGHWPQLLAEDQIGGVNDLRVRQSLARAHFTRRGDRSAKRNPDPTTNARNDRLQNRMTFSMRLSGRRNDRCVRCAVGVASFWGELLEIDLRQTREIQLHEERPGMGQTAVFLVFTALLGRFGPAFPLGFPQRLLIRNLPIFGTRPNARQRLTDNAADPTGQQLRSISTGARTTRRRAHLSCGKNSFAVSRIAEADCGRFGRVLPSRSRNSTT